MSEENSRAVFAENLNNLMQNRDVSRGQLTDDLNIRYTTLADWLNGRTFPRIDALEKIAHYFGISKSALVEQNFNSVEYRRIPVLGSIAGGAPIFAEQNMTGYINERVTDLPSGDLFYLQLVGDSMVPTIPNGAFVLIRSQEEVEDGEIAAVQVEGDTAATLKRIKRRPNQELELIPDNSRFPHILLNEDSVGRIIGKAIKYVGTLNDQLLPEFDDLL